MLSHQDIVDWLLVAATVLNSIAIFFVALHSGTHGHNGDKDD